MTIGTFTFAHVEDLSVDEVHLSANRWRMRLTDPACNTLVLSAASKEELGAWLMARANEVVNAPEPEQARSKQETAEHYQRLAAEAACETGPEAA